MTTGIRSCGAPYVTLCGGPAWTTSWGTMLRSAAGHSAKHRTARPSQAHAAGEQAWRGQATSRSPSVVSLPALTLAQGARMRKRAQPAHQQASGRYMHPLAKSNHVAAQSLHRHCHRLPLKVHSMTYSALCTIPHASPKHVVAFGWQHRAWPDIIRTPDNCYGASVAEARKSRLSSHNC